MSLELNTLYLEDCRDTLSKMADQSVHIVITSPPYNMNLRIRNGSYCSRQVVKEFSTKYEGFSDNLPIDKFYDLHSSILRELVRVSNLIFYNIQIVTGSKLAFFRMMGEFSHYLKDIIIWDKQHGQPAMQKQVLNRRSELLLVFDSSHAISRQYLSGQFERGTLDDIWAIPRERKNNSKHTATFPKKLVTKILENFSKPDSIVYDPYAGTGTTLLVAKELGFKFIGSEINPVSFDIAQKNLCHSI